MHRLNSPTVGVLGSVGAGASAIGVEPLSGTPPSHAVMHTPSLHAPLTQSSEVAHVVLQLVAFAHFSPFGHAVIDPGLHVLSTPEHVPRVTIAAPTQPGSPHASVAARGVHVPVPHDSHSPSQARSQQIPAAQTPLAHSPALPQDAPFVFLLTHAPSKQ